MNGFKESLCLESCLNPACNGLCQHLYRCNCNEIVILCKHVHKLRSFLLRTQEKNCTKVSLAVNTGNNQLKQKSQTFINENERFQKNIDEISTLISHPMIINLQLPSMNRQLEDMISQAEAIKNMNSIEIPVKPHNNLLNFEPNKKLDNQWQPNKFKRTRKENRKKEAKPYQYPAPNQKEEIVLKLSQQHVNLIHDKQSTIICDKIETCDFTNTLIT